MSIQITCESCNATHLVNDRFAGKRVRCPKCEAVVSIPTTQQAADLAEKATEVEQPQESDDDQGESEHGKNQPAVVVAAEESKKPIIESEEPQNTETQNTLVDEEEDDEPVLARNRRPEEEMDMTPMVDVTFLLLIFFMVTAAFSLQKSIEMPRQQTDAPSTSVQEEEVEELDMVEVQVDEFGSFLVMAPEWERETPGKQNLISALREAIAGNSDGMKLVVKVHELAKLKSLVDAMDAGTIAGYAQLEVMQVEEFD